MGKYRVDEGRNEREKRKGIKITEEYNGREPGDPLDKKERREED